ncbi:phosphotransferase [Allorhizobium sp. BGMRC 0089]|uniref:phosphotransferase n=1 Tax=Allorhizobium sonneratiae TaxID=2934936 RepID=UPI00203430FB|nr:phosphotransferase [Allorhizobium sonneratiae]MCM2293942.1 phosphotransferase [Allorhizobium sonneratiae]
MSTNGHIQEISAFSDRVGSAISKVPGWDDGKATWSWISGGGAHKNFIITNSSNQQAVLKLWNCDWEGLGVIPPSAVPLLNTVEAGKSGIGAPVIAIVNDPLCIMLEFIPGTPVDVKDPEILQLVGKRARDLHDSGMCFKRDFNPFAEARIILASAERKGADLPDDYKEVRKTIDRIEKALDLRPRDFVPSHNDLYSANILRQADGTIRFIDYDLSGNSDRCYDLGLISTFEGLDTEQADKLIESYFGAFDRQQRARMELLSIAADHHQLSLFAVALAAADMNDDYDYTGFMRDTWGRIQRRIDSQAFGGFLAQVEN